MIALLAALPLYTGQGYWQLGDTKYTLFCNVSMLCLGGWLLAGVPGRIGALADAMGRSRGKAAWLGGEGEAGYSQAETAQPGKSGKAGNSHSRAGLAWTLAGSLSKVDIAVAAYGVCVALSAVCSSYGALAWHGYAGWYMGAVSQLMFVGIYFFVSRQYDGAAYPIYLGEAAFFLVTVFGLLHKLGIDPLGLQYGWNSGDWEYSHMLSTLGNINWLCGFYSVALTFPVVQFFQEKRLLLRVLLYVEVTAAFVLLGIQGSQGGLLILAVCVAASVFLGRERPPVLRKVFSLLAGFFLCMPLMWLLMELRGSKAAIVRDGNVFEHIEWPVWVIAALASLSLTFYFSKGKTFFKKRADAKKNRQKKLRNVFKIGILSGVSALAILLMIFAARSVDDSFGSGRGLLWRIALESFRQSDIQDKLLGAGPDCYGAAVFDKLGAGTDVWDGEHWEGAVFTNAHNEFLSQLCNVGLLGTASYLAIFLAGLYSYGCCAGSSEGRQNGNGGGRESAKWLGILAIAMYGAHSLISFQQVLNTPLFFLVLGLCEAKVRGGAEREI